MARLQDSRLNINEYLNRSRPQIETALKNTKNK